jgi:RHS repeat-associated protein
MHSHQQPIAYGEIGFTGKFRAMRALSNLYNMKAFCLAVPAICVLLLANTPAAAQQWNTGHRIGTVTGKYQFSYNTTPGALAELDVPLYGGSLSYQWQQSSDAMESHFTNISGATSSGYTFPGALSQTMFYRRRVSDATSGTSIFSTTIRIEVVSVNWEADYNYVREHVIRIPGITDWKTIDTLSTGPKIQTTTYGDGLGRAIQKVRKETATPSSGSLWGDMVQFSVYDAYGKQPVGFLPYTTANQSGKYKTAALTEEAAYYSTMYGETSAYSTTTFDESPLDRPLNTKSPGAAWAASAGNTAAYELNETADSVRKWTIAYTSGSIPTSDGAYKSGELFRTTSTDVNGKKIVEYTDKNGRLILKKIQVDDTPGAAHVGWICTYSVFDDFGRLRFRMQPEAVRYLAANSWSLGGTDGTTVSNELCFRYEYDDQGRTVLKKAPGAKELRMLYDIRDRTVMMQDGNQSVKSTPEWTVNIYDELDRLVITTLYKTSKTLSQLQHDIDTATSAALSVSHTSPVPVNLEVSARQTGLGGYSATNSIKFLGSFESETSAEFIAEVDSAIAGIETTSLIISSRNPISSSDMANASVTTVLKYVFYDDYHFAGARSFDNDFTVGYSSSGQLIPSIAKTKRTLSYPTGSRTRILGTTTFLSSTQYYNEDGLPAQQLEENIKKGVDVSTSQYLFDGSLLSNYNKHNSNVTGYGEFGTLTKNILDKLGRVIQLQQQYGSNSLTTLASYDYDDAGRLKTKHLAPGYTGSGRSEMEALDYSYNINGQITGINKDYALKAGSYSKWDRFFGLYLGFDNSDGVFGHAQLNGQVGGLLWNTQGDDAQRKYEYSYDNAGRLSKADFAQKEKTSDSWSNSLLDFSVSGSNGKIEYDLNGNILKMLQKGVIAGGSPINIDDLSYSYSSYTNKLKSVTDGGTAGSANGSFGDFKDGTNGSVDDYVYDDNGNLIVDLNKKVEIVSGSPGGIKYNYLDKPEEIKIAGKGTLNIVYDADGNKLQRTWTPTSGPARTTTYINGFVYEGDALQFINFQEGRIRIMQPVSQSNSLEGLAIDGDLAMPEGKKGSFDYFIRDYQQNVRMILTQETHSSFGTATMETARAGVEEPVFGQVENNEVSQTRFSVNSIPGQLSGNGWNNSHIDSSVSKTSKLTHKIGPNSLLKVMAGDKLNATTQYFYKSAATNSANQSQLTEVVQSLLQAILGSAATNAATKGATTSIGTQLGSNVPLNDVVAPNEDATDNIPKAYLSVLFFDERFNFVSESSQSLRVTTADASDASLTLGPNIKVPKNGYAYIYVSNESDEPVYFDNFKVSHERGRIIEEDHYYAFGLKIAGISSKKMADAHEGMVDNKYLYNDKELFDDGDLGWLDYGFRNYDAQIGRFPQLDPLTNDYPFLTPFQYGSNDPIGNIDLDGLEGISATGLADVVVHNTPKAAKVATSSASSLFSTIGGFVKKGAEMFTTQILNVVAHVGTAALGAANAWSSDQLLGQGLIDAKEKGLTDSKGLAFQIGQKIGHAASIVTGLGEMGVGGIGEIASLGLASPVAIPIALHGSTAFGFGLFHLLNGKIVYSTGSEGTGGSSGSSQPKYRNSDKPPFADDAKAGKNNKGVKGWFDKKGNFVTKGDKPGEWHVNPNPKNRNPLWRGEKPKYKSKQPYWNVKDDGSIHH